MGGTSFILLIALVCLLGPFIRMDNTVDANQQNLVIAKQKPGFKVRVIEIPLSKNEEESNFLEKWMNGGYPNEYNEVPINDWRISGDEVIIEKYQPEAYASMDIETFTIPLPDFTTNTDLSDPTEAVNFFVKEKKYVLGTDKYGRDLLSRLMAGALISLSVGFVAVFISLVIGIFFGALAGYYGGRIDDIISFIINVMWSIPTLLLVMAVTLAFGKGFWKVFLAVGLTMWVEVARVVRGQFISLREKEFVEASRALGFSDMRIIFKHILPNAINPVIVIAAANFAAAILIEAGLSFLGIGAQIPTPSWGNMIKEHYSLITTDLAYLALIPGVLIMLLVLSFMMVGNGLRDALDTR